ncbi:MAG: TRAP transporter substrate-binding protein [Rhodospirillales bacterium]
MAGIIVACASGAQAQQTIKFGGATINDSLHRWQETFKKQIEASTRGRIKVEVYPAGQLGSIPRQIEGLQLGSQEMFIAVPAFLVGLDKRFMVTDAPGVITDLDHGFRVTHDMAFAKAFWNLGEPKGVKGVGMFCSELATYVTRTPVRKLEDFKGKKIRVFASPIEREAMRRLGVAGTPMALGEVLPALQQGALDGARSGVSIWTSMKFHTAAKYLTRTDEQAICSMGMVAKSWFEKLSPDHQNAVLNAAADADEDVQEWSNTTREKQFEDWTKAGGEVIRLTPADQAELVKLMATVGDDVVKENPEIAEMYKLFRETAERTRR